MALYKNAAPIVQDNLVFAIDPVNLQSYPGSGTTVNDLHPNGNNVTLLNGVGFDGKALTFDGVDDCGSADTLPATVGNNTVGTIDLWIKPAATTPSTFEYILQFGDTAGSDTRISIYHETAVGRLEFFCRGNGSTNWQKHTLANPFTADTWVNVTLVQDAASPVIYINGVAVGQGFSISNDLTAWFNTANMANIDNFRLGCYNNNGSGNILHYTGATAQVMYYNTNFTAAQVLQNHKALKRKYF